MNSLFDSTSTSILAGGLISSVFGVSNPLVLMGAAAGVSAVKGIYNEHKDIFQPAIKVSQLADNLKGIIGLKFFTLIITRNDAVIFNKLESYIINKYSSNLVTSKVDESQSTRLKLSLDSSAVSKPIIDHYKGERILLLVKNSNEIHIKSQSLDLEMLKEYAKGILILKLGLNTICVHQPVIEHFTTVFSKDKKQDEGKQKGSVTWNTFQIQTNKTFKNTILTEQVTKDLVEDLKQFTESEDYYNTKGIPYKRGYLLYGPPGTGKTSILKSMASQYNMDIFLINMGEIRDEKDLTLVFQGTRSCSGYHMLCFEDIDRCKLFDKDMYRYNDDAKAKNNSIIRTFLNELDGVIETPNRITVLTANDKTMIESFNALIRPGRIDKMVNIDYCDTDQMNRLFNHFSDCGEELKLKSLDYQITPAQVVKYILNNPEMSPNEIKCNMEEIHKIKVSDTSLTNGVNIGKNRRQRSRRLRMPLTIAKMELTRMERTYKKVTTNYPERIKKKKIQVEKLLETKKRKKERERQKKEREKLREKARKKVDKLKKKK